MTKKLLMSAILAGFASTSFAQNAYPGLSYPQPKVSNTPTAASVDELLSSRITNKDDAAKNEVGEMRRQAIVEVATALGASAGLSSRMKQIRAEVDSNSSKLDRTFDFSKTLIDNGVLAPVLLEGLSNYSQESTDEVRIQDKIYKVDSPAKFVSVYPTWRSYLIFSFPGFEKPAQAYLPKNEGEKMIWDESVKEGWSKGVSQANHIFEASYNKLEKEFKGRILYKTLLAEGLITPTIIAKQNLGVTGGGKEMAINDQIFRITDHSALNPNQKEWKVEYPVTSNVDGKLK